MSHIFIVNHMCYYSPVYSRWSEKSLIYFLTRNPVNEKYPGAFMNPCLLSSISRRYCFSQIHSIKGTTHNLHILRYLPIRQYSVFTFSLYLVFHCFRFTLLIFTHSFVKYFFTLHLVLNLSHFIPHNYSKLLNTYWFRSNMYMYIVDQCSYSVRFCLWNVLLIYGWPWYIAYLLLEPFYVKDLLL